jgi:N-acetyl sugar amidotransferase
LDWDKRHQDLKELCDKYRCDNGGWDVVVPCSGGKDGSLVAFKLRDEHGMNPLCITFQPQLQTDIGHHNLESFKKAGFDHILICPNPDVYRRFSKHTFIMEGRPVQPFTMGISTAVIRTAISYGIPFIMYGEEGEQEYGGATTQIGRYLIDRDYLVNYYYSGNSPESYLNFFTPKEMQWWMLPSDKELKDSNLFITHWSHFYFWDSKRHYDFIQDMYDFRTRDQVGTFTDYGQLDCLLHELQVFLMHVKFGFGRCWADVCIGIRGGYLSRDEGIELVKRYDGLYPWHNHQAYLDYFGMDDDEFWNVIDRFRSPDVWKRDVNGKWSLNFEIR